MSVTRYGIIGSGMMAHEHIRNLALFEDTAVVAVADPDPGMRQSAMALAGARGYGDHRDLLAAEDLDALIIAAPNHTHHGILADVMKTEIPILCEKPLGISVDQCRDIARWAERRRAPVWVAMEYRFMDPLQRLLTEVAAGQAGQLRMVSIREHRFPFLEKIGDWNRFSANTGGTLVEKCCHHFDLMRLILGGANAVRVYASGAMDVNHLDERYGGKTPDIIDNAFVIVDFDTGARGMLDLAMFAEGAYWQEIVTATGDRGRIEARIPAAHGVTELRHGEVSIAPRAGAEVTETIKTAPDIMAVGAHHGSTYFQHQRFLALVRQGGVPDVSVADGLAAVAIGAAAEESARSGAAITL